MRTTHLKTLRNLQLGFGVLALVVTCLSASVIHPESAALFPATYADPAVPLLQWPTNFRARRTTANLAMTPGKPVEIFNATGAGCVRHLWFVFGERNIDDLSIEITVDGAAEPQVRMPFRSFFGALLGFEDYHIDSAGLANFPNFTVTNDPMIPKKASPGWNLYLPIPFSKGCRIVLLAGSGKNGGGMIDWQQYRNGVKLTPLRFHAQRNIAQPGNPSESFPITETEGAGFLAGYVMGWRQRDHGDMVFHNSGTRLLIDGQTDPHVICGHNVEDDFGFSWGFNQYQTRWAGCPYRDNRGRTDQDGVFYRFFGPDPIPFRSSLIFTSAARPDDYEAVSYFYKVPGSKAPPFVAPQDWQVVGPFPEGKDIEAFKKPADDLVRQLSQANWPDKVTVGAKEFTVHNLTPKYGWVRLEGVYQTRYPYPRTDQSVYVRGTLTSGSKRRAKLRLGLDNWAIVYLNGQQVAMLDHAEEFDTVKVPVTLNKGTNQLLIKTNNRQNRERHLWAIHCAVE
ncbi:MAG: DUF2961 domain-containing protein [Pedosphaera sp.]|nr:DUF2961 domain-containing protein [Pedosphaera sp.]